MSVNPRQGRPRDPDIDAAVLAAARDLLAEVGYRATTLAAIARRASVGVPAIYRRWPSKADLILDAIGSSSPPVDPEGDLETELRSYVKQVCTTLADPVTAAAIPGLLHDLHEDPGVRKRLRETTAPSGETFRALLEKAAARGEISNPEMSGVAMIVISGAAQMQAMNPGARRLKAFIDDLTAFVLAALR